MIVGMFATFFLYGLKCLTQKLCVVIVERRTYILKFIYGEHFLLIYIFYFLLNRRSERFCRARALSASLIKKEML